MKWINIVFLLLITLVGCNEETLLPGPEDPKPVAEKATVIAKAVNGVEIDPSGTKTYDKGSTVLYTLSIKEGYILKSALVNGKAVVVENNTIPLEKISLLENTIEVEGILINNAILSKGADDKSLAWHLKNLSYYNDKNEFLDSLLLVQTPSRLTDNNYYYSNGTYESISTGGKLIANGKWAFDGNFFIDWTNRCPIVEISDKKFVYDCVPFMDSNGILTHQRVTLVRK